MVLYSLLMDAAEIFTDRRNANEWAETQANPVTGSGALWTLQRSPTNTKLAKLLRRFSGHSPMRSFYRERPTELRPRQNFHFVVHMETFAGDSTKINQNLLTASNSCQPLEKVPPVSVSLRPDCPLPLSSGAGTNRLRRVPIQFSPAGLFSATSDRPSILPRRSAALRLRRFYGNNNSRTWGTPVDGVPAKHFAIGRVVTNRPGATCGPDPRSSIQTRTENPPRKPRSVRGNPDRATTSCRSEIPGNRTHRDVDDLAEDPTEQNKQLADLHPRAILHFGGLACDVIWLGRIQTSCMCRGRPIQTKPRPLHHWTERGASAHVETKAFCICLAGNNRILNETRVARRPQR